MSKASLSWTKEKQQSLCDQLIDFWSQNEWDMSRSSLSQSPLKRPVIFRFKCQAENINTELKYACWQRLINGDWRLTSGSHITHQINRLTRWLNEVALATQSLLEKSVDQWELSLRTYLVENGMYHSRTKVWLDRTQTLRKVQADDRALEVFRVIYQLIANAYDNRSEYEKDVWDLRKMGFHPSQTKAQYKLDFASIHQPWLYEAAKRYFRYWISVRDTGTPQNRLTALSKFSSFLHTQYPTLEPHQINRSVILDYIAYLSTTGLAVGTRNNRLVVLRVFLETCAREGWASVPDKMLIYDDDLPKWKWSAPRFIPQDVLDQLFAHLLGENVPVYLRRMILILSECGMRADELLNLTLDCLDQDAEGDFWIKFRIFKIKKDHRLPITRELAAEIQEQQQEIKKIWGNEINVLFPTSKGKPFSQCSVRRNLNEIGYKNKIEDSTGKLWRFSLHQFRHTLGTQMINHGASQYDVQKTLGHESSAMTHVYAHMFDSTQKRAFENFQKARGPLINIKGEMINLNPAVDSAERQMLKHQIGEKRLALHDGHCTLPLVKGPCPKFNACYQCTWFVTERKFLPLHTTRMEEVNADLAKARANGWVRHIEKLEKDQESLEIIIRTLEQSGGDTDESQTER